MIDEGLLWIIGLCGLYILTWCLFWLADELTFECWKRRIEK